MYINSLAYYVPELVVPNSYFKDVNGLDDSWIEERTGIKERRKAAPEENTNTMALEAVKRALVNLPYPQEESNLIVGATYSPYDTVGTLAHVTQKYLGVDDIPAVSVSSACSSFLNAMEIVEGYFAMGKATKALVVVSEHNTKFSNETDTKAGHLWGDGSAAFFVSKERQTDKDFEVLEIITGGAATTGKGPEGVTLRPRDGGIEMLFGKDVFINACQYMTRVTKTIVEKNNFDVADITYFIPHQANNRITENVAKQLNLTKKQALTNIQYLGNTGCAGSGIALAENQDKYQKDDLVVVTVFGGGYSFGSMLIKC